MQGDTRTVLGETRLAPNHATRPNRLVVLVPGFMGRCSRWAHLRAQLEHEPGFAPREAQWLDFDHHSNWSSVGRMEELALQLRARIEAEWIKAGGFNDVILVGHSMGGLIVRQAYLLASGAVPGEEASRWASRVSRVVLMASLNRGVELKRAPWLRVIAWIVRILPFVPHLRVTDVIRGSDFLTGLRINWIRHFGEIAEAERRGARGEDHRGKRSPVIVQLLGTKDGVVDKEDSKDLLAFPGGHYLEVPDADHKVLYRIELAPDPALRYAVLREGFVGNFQNDVVRDSADDPIRRVVFLLHGIRASNVDAWVKGLERRIKDRDPQHTIVRHPTYGYFTAMRFALPTVRRKNIAVFQDWYTEALAEHPTAEFNIIAHSNGTYIFGRSLLATPGMRFTNVALAGSVLPQDFWQHSERLRKQIGRIRNDRANRDWPVALLCGALTGLRMRDVGTAGFAGFLGGATDEIAYYPGGHGEALKPDYQDLLVDFIFGGVAKEPAKLSESPGYFRQLSNAMPYLAPILVLAAAAGIGWFVFEGGVVHAQRAALAALTIIGAYVILDIV